MTQKSKFPKNPVCVILWRDAAFTNTKHIPRTPPPLQLTTGFIIEATDEFTNIATNVNYNREDKTIYPVDGFIIPEKAIVKFKKIGDLGL